MMISFDQQAVIDSFSRAAKTYDKHAEFQRIAGHKLLAILEAELADSIQTQDLCNIADLGCGTGFFTRQLSQRFPHATVTGVDIASGMLEVCKSSSDKEVYYQADVCELPFEDSSQHIIFSNLTFQWIEQLPRLFAELERIRAENGVIVFTTLGENTLHELKSAWRSVDNHEHINSFIKVSDLSLLGLAQWETFLVSEENIVMPYYSVMDIMRDLKGIGAQHRGHDRRKGLMKPSAIKQLEQAYTRHQCDQGQLPVTYQLVLALIR